MARKFTKVPQRTITAATNTGNKELITIDYEGDTCALYKAEYAYGGGIALFLYDITADEDWGDLTINLPGGYSGTFLQDYISNDVVNALSNVFKVVDRIRCNYGTYRMIEFRRGMEDKIPDWDELVELINQQNNG